jgi:hypothetical protein
LEVRVAEYQDSDRDPRSEHEKLVTELLKNARAADKIDRERGELMQALVQTPAWRAYNELLGFRIQNFADSVLAPSGSINGMVAQEYLKGAMSGLIIARDLPTIIIAAMREIPRAANEGED